MKKRVIICGYPKSGNTWLTRLTAELIGCPVVGFWRESGQEDITTEGADRVSEFECYKAHHSAEELQESLERIGNGTEKVIFIVRDPRDVAVSAFYYFRPGAKYPLIRKVFRKLRMVEMYFTFFQPQGKWYRTLIDSMIQGTTELPWMETPWNLHAEGHLASDALLVKYEDLLEDPHQESGRILRYLGLTRDPEAVAEAIRVQSFEVKKRTHKKAGDRRREFFLRSGSTGEWKKVLKRRHAGQIEEAFAETMKKLGYLQ